LRDDPIFGDFVPGVLIVVGALLLLLTLGLAFTSFGEISAVLGVTCIVIGVVKHSRRAKPNRPLN
jgi:hypothetical protein